jgi:hypothetical protein
MDLELPPLADSYDSPEHELYSMHVRKLITPDEYFTQNAIMVAARSHLHLPVFVPAFHPTLSDYVESRLTENEAPFDGVLVSKLLRWLVVYSTAVDENKTRISTLAWALDRVPSALQPEIKTLEVAIGKHKSTRYLSAEMVSKITRVLEKDGGRAPSHPV